MDLFDIAVARKLSGGGGGGGGDSDFSTAQVTFTNQAGAMFLLANIFDDGGEANMMPATEGVMGIANAVLYKGAAIGIIMSEGDVTVTTSGNLVYDDGIVFVTGDGTITIS